MTKKRIQKIVDNISGYSLDGNIQDAINILEGYKEQYGSSLILDYGQHDRYDDSYSYALYLTREETEEEYIARKETEREQAILNLERLKKEVERLGKVVK